MQKKLYQELWNLRFQKMLALEEQSIVDYKDLIKECNKFNDEETVEKLKQLIVDETRHAKLVRELIKIVKRQGE